jgi:4-amino-4-deoxy-L-arabinose transferase-like glycosyltransferase
MLELPLDLRAVTAGFGVAITLLVLALVTRAAGRVAGVIAALLVATDPFVIRFDSRVMLEAPAMTWVVAGYLALLPAIQRRDERLAAVAGLFFGLALITKEPTAFLTVLPLLALAAGRFTAPRRIPLTAFAACCLVWLVPLVVLVASGDVGEWFDEKGSGVLRLVGAVQETGFNQPGAQPFTAKLVDNLVHLGSTYALFATGGLSAVWLAARWWRRRGAGAERDAQLVVSLWQLSASALLFYAMGFGTLEEQMFYLLAIPSIATSAIAASIALRSRTLAGVAIPVLLLAGVLAFNGQAWAATHVRERDDAYAQFVRWAEPRLAAGTTVAVTEDTMQFVLRDLDLGTWATPAELGREDAEYVLVSTRLADEGYGTGTPELIAFLESIRAPVVFRAQGRTLGELRLYDVSHYTGGGA